MVVESVSLRAYLGRCHGRKDVLVPPPRRSFAQDDAFYLSPKAIER